MSRKINLYTSLPPNAKRSIGDMEIGRAYLAQCVHSWRRADFHVISLNSAEEIDALSRLGFDVEFKEIAAGRPSIADFLSVIRAAGDPIAAIINADIFLSNHPELGNAVAERSADGMVILERINIDPVNLRPTGIGCNGFDAFVFNTAPLARIDLDLEFLFGQPWWDYWLALAYAAGGGKLMKLGNPILFHLDHPQKWNQDQWVANGQKTVKYFLRSTGDLPGEFAAQLARFAHLPRPGEAELGPFGHWCFAKLRAMAELIPPSRKLTNGALNGLDIQDLIGGLNEVHATVVGESGTIALPAAEPPSQLPEILRLKSHSVLGRPIQDHADAVEVMREVNRILVSRKAAFRHLMTLHIAWIRRKFFGECPQDSRPRPEPGRRFTQP